MVSGLASRGSAQTHQRKRYPARYCDSMMAASVPSTILPASAKRERLRTGFQGATPARRVIPHLFNAALAVFDAELHDHVDQQIQQILDLLARKLLACSALLDQKYQLLEGELCTRGMDAGDRARVPAVDVPQVVEGFFTS